MTETAVVIAFVLAIAWDSVEAWQRAKKNRHLPKGLRVMRRE